MKSAKQITELRRLQQETEQRLSTIKERIDTIDEWFEIVEALPEAEKLKSLHMRSVKSKQKRRDALRKEQNDLEARQVKIVKALAELEAPKE